MFLSIKENQFIAKNQPIVLRGAGLGNWLNLEHFLIGIPGTEGEIRKAVIDAYGEEAALRFWRAYRQHYVGEADIRFLAELGFNSARLPVNARAFFDGASFEESTGVAELDRVIALYASHGLYSIIDLHAAFGGQNPDWHSDNTSGDYPFFSNESFRSQTIALWESIARRYKDNPFVGGYDLINEPCYFEKELDDVLVRFYADCIDKIRRIDNRHIIFLEGNIYARDFSMFQENLDDNLAYTFHYYPFLQLPGQLHGPGLRARMRDSLYADVTLRHLQENLKRPLWCGETGHPLHQRETVGALAEFLDLLEEMHISWSLWPHKDARAMALCYPKESSDYLGLIKQASSNWRFWDIFNQDSILSAEGESDKHTFYRAIAQNSTDANRRFAEALKRIPFDVFLKSLDDLTFRKCERNEPLISCLPSRTGP